MNINEFFHIVIIFYYYLNKHFAPMLTIFVFSFAVVDLLDQLQSLIRNQRSLFFLNLHAVAIEILLTRSKST